MPERPKIAVLGLGRLGAPLAACFAARSFHVVGYDPVPEKVEAVRARRALTYEPGLEDMLGLAAANLRVTTDLAEAVRDADASFLVVPTPSAPDGAFSIEHVLTTAQQVGEVLRDRDGYHCVAIASSMMPGTTQRQVRLTLEAASGKTVGEDFGLCYAPLFVTMGNVVRDFLRPSMCLVGEWDRRSGDILTRIYEATVENEAPVVRMSLSNAELTKLAVNVYVTTKISFANMLARLCELMPGGDVDVVTAAMQHDARVGKGALCGAIAYGGPFFDRDNLALGALLIRLTVAPELVGVLGRFNRAQVPWLADKVQERVPAGGRAAVLGLAYKPDTDEIVDSVGIELCEQLEQRAISVIAHDPVAMEMARGALPRGVELAGTAREAIEQADVVCLATPWQVYRDLPPETWAPARGASRVVVDCWRVIPHVAQQPGVEYVPLGIGPGPSMNGVRPAPGCRADG